MSFLREKFLLAVVSLGLGILPARACNIPEPQLALQGINFYDDVAQSIPNREREEENQRLNLPFRIMIAEATKDLDQDGSFEGCAQRILISWADHGALLQNPAASTARVLRIHAVNALNIIALKIRSKYGGVDDKIIDWLQKLTRLVNIDYNRNSLQNTPYFRNGAYVWSGVAAATAAILRPNQEFLDFADTCWRDALANIRQDGLLQPDLYRGQRALIYSQSSLAAMVILESTRSTLRLDISSSDERKIEKTFSVLGSALCDDAYISAQARVYHQENPGDWMFRIHRVFARNYLTNDWFKCSSGLNRDYHWWVGGDIGQSFNVIRGGNILPHR